MYLVKTPGIVKWPQLDLVWSFPNEENNIYLTFDDGPIPEVTDWVLDCLKTFNAKATFFVVGENAAKHNTILQRILEEGHIVGNHTHNHLSGWSTNDKLYLENTHKAQEVYKSKLFRPPYGRIKRSQIKALSQDFKIIMWDVLSGDFDEKITGEKCAENVLKNVKSGSIIVFHDSLKALPRLKVALPIVLKELQSRGFNFKEIS